MNCKIHSDVIASSSLTEPERPSEYDVAPCGYSCAHAASCTVRQLALADHAASVAAGGIPLGPADIVGQDVYWLEGKPLEGGRSVLVRQTPLASARS